MEQKNRIQILATTQYMEGDSNPDNQRYVFSYTITIKNVGTQPAKLLSRHWLIKDSNGKVQEVNGEGVVGEQPHLKPGDYFRYTSAVMIETAVGVMSGEYTMVTDEGNEFEAPISEFALAIPRTLH